MVTFSTKRAYRAYRKSLQSLQKEPTEPTGGSLQPRAYSLKEPTGQSTGIYVFIFVLKNWRVSESFTSLGKIPHIFGTGNDIDSVPYLTDLNLHFSRNFS